MFGPTRTHATWKPRVGEGDLAFFQTPGSAWYALGLCSERKGGYEESSERSRLFSPDYFVMCDASGPVRKVDIASADETHPALRYRIVGGFEHNAIEVSWAEHARPRLIALKTFTGIQVKYLQPDKLPPVVFALADEDAYCYCDENPCKQCSFNCKSGFALYALFNDIGIVRTDIDCISKD